jgi:16S rRNA (cytosine967-C5)-methyltransferase
MVLTSSEKTGRSRSGGQKRTQQKMPNAIPDKPGFAARMAASKLLAAVIDQKTSMDGMLDEDHGNPAYRALNPADRALVKAILHAALRHLAWIEAIFASYVDNPLPEGARNLRHILTVAAAQILFLNVPDHSAVDLAVEEASRDPRSRRFASLVNALLRRLSREKDTVLDGVRGRVSLFPDWFRKRLEKAYGSVETAEIERYFLEPAAIDITVKSDPAEWAKKLDGVILPTGSVRLAKFEGAIPTLPGFDDGQWWVQDAAAAIPVRLFGSISGKRAIDLCAAPGGKTAQMALQGAHVTALDQSASRLKRLKTNLARLGLDVDVAQAKLEEYKPDFLFDAVLLDAPCSSTGTIRRHPDVIWTKGLADIEKLAIVQYRLLRASFELVAPGGLLVFSNCSLDQMEGENLAARFLKDQPKAELVPIRASDWPGLEKAVTEAGYFRTTPATGGGMDGFFAAVFRRKL